MKNIKIILIIALVFIVVACGGAESRKEKYLASAQEYYDNDDCAKAKLEYKNVLQIDPKDTQGRVGLARCLIQDQEWRNAYQLLNSVIADDANHVNAKFEVAKFLILVGESDKAYQHISEILTVNPEHAGAIALRGIFHIKNNTLVAARKDAQEALAIDKSNLLAVTINSAIQMRDGNTGKSIELVKETLVNADLNKREEKELQILLIGLYGQAKQLNETVPIFEDLISKYPKQIQYTNQLAAIYANNKQLDKGEALLLKAVDESDNDSSRMLAYIAYIHKFRGSEQATSVLEKHIQADGSKTKLKLALGQRYLKENRVEAARKIFEELAAGNNLSESNSAKNQLAFMHLKDGKTDAALRLVEEVLNESPGNIRALMMRGTVALSRRDAPQAIGDFRTILRDQPNNLTVIRQLATAYILNGQEDLAKDVVQKAVEIDSSNKDLNLLYARLQGSDKEFDSAIETVNNVLLENEKDLASIKTLFDLQVANNDYSGAKKTADRIKLASEDNPLGYYLSGVLLQSEQKFDEAEKEYLIALDKNPRGNEPLSGLIKLYLSQKKVDQALAYLNGLIEKDPDYLVPYNLRGELGIATKNYSLATQSFEEAIKVNNEWWVPYRGLSLAFAAQNKINDSMQVLERGINNGANIERLGVDLALMQYRYSKRDLAIKTYEEIIEKAPNSALAKNNLAMILVDDDATEESIAQALEHVASLEDIEDAASLDTVGWVYYKAGDLNRAVELLTRAIELAPDAAELHYHLGMTYADQGSLDKAKKHLEIATTSEQKYQGREHAQRKLDELR